MPDAVLFWGIELPPTPPWGDEDWGLWLCARLGMISPRARRVPTPAQAERDIEEETGCTVGSFGHDDPPRYFLAIAGSVLRVAANEAAAIETTEVASEWHEQLRELCEELELPECEPSWNLTVEMRR